MTLFFMMLVAALAGYGAAIVLVEKKNQWPATAIRPIVAKVLGWIYAKLPDMLECSVCTSFWTSMLAFIYISLITGNWAFVIAAPVCGFIGIAITWSMIELMNAIDPK